MFMWCSCVNFISTSEKYWLELCPIFTNLLSELVSNISPKLPYKFLSNNSLIICLYFKFGEMLTELFPFFPSCLSGNCVDHMSKATFIDFFQTSHKWYLCDVVVLNHFVSYWLSYAPFFQTFYPELCAPYLFKLLHVFISKLNTADAYV